MHFYPKLNSLGASYLFFASILVFMDKIDATTLISVSKLLLMWNFLLVSALQAIQVEHIVIWICIIIAYRNQKQYRTILMVQNLLH